MKIEDYNKYYIQGSDHYLIPKDEFKELFNEMINWREETKELRKQREEYIKQNMKLKNELFDKRKEYQDTYKDVRIEIKEYKTQQKEFINYLENEIKLYENDIQNFKKDYKVYFSLINDLRVSKAKIEEILQKYKEIIGVEDDTN